MRTASLQFKVLGLVAFAIAVLLAVSIAALAKVYGSIEELDRVSREDFQSQETILRAANAFRAQGEAFRDALLQGRDTAAVDRYWGAFEAAEKEAATHAKEARAGSGDAEVRSGLQTFIDAHQAAAAKFREAMAAFRKEGDGLAAQRVAVGLEEAPLRALASASAKADERGAKSVALAVGGAETVFRWAIAGLVLSMVAALMSLWAFMRRAVLDPIRDAARVAERIAEGDLTADIRSRSSDEAGQLVAALGRMNGSLIEVVSQVRNSAHSVVTAAAQVSAGTTDLSQRTEEQASSLEETAASMEELASTVKQNADNAREADTLARNASQRAEQGGSEVVRVVMTMGEISDSAKRIADIISVIDGIAFQTNILALNAAVEAARAGEQGRGFAVVASEVRSLAQRSAQAAKEIKGLINASVAKVDDGTRLVEQAGDTIQALVIDVKRVSDLMGSIAEASAEQSRGVQQVNKTVTEMDKVVQQNASAVQQSAAAAEAMRQQAHTLAQAVGTFRLSPDERLGGEEDLPELVQPAPAPVREAAPGPARATPIAKEGARKPAALAAGDDDWEEF